MKPDTQQRTMTKKNAQKMALNIQAYWLSQGHVIHVWVERTGANSLSRDFSVRSNMKNGLPVKRI